MTIMSATFPQDLKPTSPTPSPDSHEPEPLALLSVLASGLPAELGTPAEPSLYTVPVVFSRRVTPQERARIEDPAAAAMLMAETGAGPGLGLEVDDRRLLISGTNLTQLESGLAAAIGRMLSTLGEELHTARTERAAAAEVRLGEERQRADAVAQTAARIRFGPAEDPSATSATEE